MGRGVFYKIVWLFFSIALVAAAPASGALTPPPDLDEVGRKLWVTLIDGEPQWQNWRELMFRDPADERARRQLDRILDAVDAQIDVKKTYALAAGRLFRWIESAPEFRAIGLDLSSPSEYLRRLLERRLSGGGTRPPRLDPYARAFNEIRVRDNIVNELRMTEAQKRDVAVLGWRYAQAEEPADQQLTAQEAERWAKETQSEIERLCDREELAIYQAMVRDPRLVPELELIELRSGFKFRPWSNVYSASSAPRVFPREELAPEVQEVLMKSGTNGEDLAYANHPELGPIAVSSERGFLDPDHDTSIVYDLERARRRPLYAVARSLVDTRRSLLWMILFYVQRQGGPLTHASFEVAVRRASRGGHVSSVDGSDWAERLYRKITPAESVDYGFHVLPEHRNGLWAWQIQSRGFEFWAKRATGPALARLPVLELRAEFSHRGRDASDRSGGSAVSVKPGLASSSEIKGHGDIPDPFKFDPVYRATGLFPRGRRWRLPSFETLQRIPPGVYAESAFGLNVTALEPTALQTIVAPDGHHLLPVPTPEGFRPSVNRSMVRVKRGWRRLYARRREFDLRADVARGVYAIDLGKGAVEVTSATFSLARVEDLAPKFPEPLVFSAAHLGSVVNYLRSVGAHVLADKLALETSVSARRLALLVKFSGLYTCAARAGGLANFVGEDGWFRLQCATAARTLKDLLTRALETHPARDRVRFEIVTSVPARRRWYGFDLTVPLHAEVDVYVGDRLSETLDATPSHLERVTSAKATGEADVEVWAPELEDLRQITTARLDLRRAVSGMPSLRIDPYLPLPKILRVVTLAERVARERVGEVEMDAAVLRREASGPLDADLADRAPEDVVRELARALEAWQNRLRGNRSFESQANITRGQKGKGDAPPMNEVTAGLTNRAIEAALDVFGRSCAGDLADPPHSK